MAGTPKGYWIVRADVADADAYAAYIAANAEAFAAHGARFLVRGPGEPVEGEGRARNVVIEFPSVAAARACHASEAYRAAAALRAGAADVDLVIAEGYDGPQPGAG